jgi:hypothetical protein
VTAYLAVLDRPSSNGEAGVIVPEDLVLSFLAGSS